MKIVFVLSSFLFASEHNQGCPNSKEILVSTRGKPWLKFKWEVNYEKQWILRTQRKCPSFALFSFLICFFQAIKTTLDDSIYWKPCLRLLPSNKRNVHARWYSCTGQDFLLFSELHLCFHKSDLWHNDCTELPNALWTNPTGKVPMKRATAFPMPWRNSHIAHTKSTVSRLNFSHDKFRQLTFI